MEVSGQRQPAALAAMLAARRVPVTVETLAAVRRHAAGCYPAEAIGLLGAVGDVVCLAAPLTNVSPRAGVSTLVGIADRDARRAEIAAAGAVPLGTYHSHPDGPAHPSMVDRRTVPAASLELIVGVGPGGAGALRAWWMRPGADPMELEVRPFDASDGGAPWT